MNRSTVSLKAGQMSSHSERKIRTHSLKDTYQNTLFPSPSRHAKCCPGKVSESLGSPGPSHSLTPVMRSKAVQSSRRAPACVIVLVADAPYSPGAEVYSACPHPQGACVRCFLFSGDSARPQCDVAQGCTGGAVCVGKMLVLESTEGNNLLNNLAQTPPCWRALWKGQLTQEY